MITTVKDADGFDHHPKCFQVRPEGPMPEFPDVCDCKTLWMLEYAALRERVHTEPAPDVDREAGERCGAGWEDAPEPYRVHHDTGTCGCGEPHGHTTIHRCLCGGERDLNDPTVFDADGAS